MPLLSTLMHLRQGQLAQDRQLLENWLGVKCRIAEHLFTQQHTHEVALWYYIYPQVTISGGVPVFPYNGSLINLDVSETRTTGWVTVAEETDHSHVDELVTGHG